MKRIISILVFIVMPFNNLNAQNDLNLEDLTKKQIVLELDVAKALDILINNSNYKINIKTWNETKVKVEAIVYHKGKSELSDEQWFKKLNITLSLLNNAVQLKCKNPDALVNLKDITTLHKKIAGDSYSINSSGFIPVFHGKGEYIGAIQGGNNLTLYIPVNSALEIDNKFADLNFTSDIKNLVLNNTNGHVDALNIDKLTLHSSNSSFTAGVIENGNMELKHDRIRIEDLDTASITSSYCVIEIKRANSLRLHSHTDELEIEEVANLYGFKNYGSLHIFKLKSKIDVKGVNADIRIRSFDPTTELVRINNHNADLRMPIQYLENYVVEIKGSYNDLYAPFLESMTKEQLTEKEIEEIVENTNSLSNTKKSINKITDKIANPKTRQDATILKTNPKPYTKNTAAIGDTKGKHTKFLITCTNCTLDFK